MADKFDRQIRLAIAATVAYARGQGFEAIGGEHLLVGLARVPSAAATALAQLGVDATRMADAVERDVHGARLLAGLGIDLAEVHRQVGHRLGTRGRVRRTRLRPDVRAAIEASRAARRAYGSRRIRSEHLLLGLLGTSVPAQELLLALDVDVLHLRRLLMHACGQGG